MDKKPEAEVAAPHTPTTPPKKFFLWSLILFIFSALAWLGRALFGRWNPPVWLRLIGNIFSGYWEWLCKHKRIRALHFLAPLGFYAYVVGQPYLVEFFTPKPEPALTYVEQLEEKIEPVSLSLSTPSNTPLGKFRLIFNKDVAPLDDEAKAERLNGVSIQPKIEGQWSWYNNNSLVFTPTQNWLPGAEYKVTLDKPVLLGDLALHGSNVRSFSIPTFRVTNTKIQFYQDPIDNNQKKVVAEYTFSYPVDPVLFERSLKLSANAGLEFADPKAADFNVTYSQNGYTAYVHTKLINIPKLDRTLRLVLDSEVKSTLGGNKLSNKTSLSQTIPGRGKLKITDIDILVVDEGEEPQQVLSMYMNFPVAEQEIRNKTKFWLLPEGKQELNEKNLAASQPLRVEIIPGEFENSQRHNFKLDIPAKRSVVVQVEEGLLAVGGYEMLEKYTGRSYFSQYATKLSFIAEGNLLSIHGDKKIAILSRGLQKFNVRIAHVLPEQAHVFMHQNNSLQQDRVYDELLDSLVVRFKQTHQVVAPSAKKMSITPIDLGALLAKENLNNGLFIVDIEQEGHRDIRLISLTDTGLIAKYSDTGAVDIFAASVSQGQPLTNALVELLSVNGKALVRTRTNNQGHAQFDASTLKKLSGHNEKAKLMYRITKGQDIAYLPYWLANREVNFSRFPVGGLNQPNAQQLSAYAFSDRRLYRPGEEAHLMFIVKSGDWSLAATHNFPLQVEVFDPRGRAVLKERVRLHATGFNSIDFALPETALTGEYIFQVKQIIDEKHNNYKELGSHIFNVREFEPDRLKVTASLVDQALTGWIKPQDLIAKVDVQHLFGAPAEGARVEGSLNLVPAALNFPQFREYKFQSLANSLRSSVYHSLNMQTTDAEGKATFDLDLNQINQTAYTVHLTAQAFEKDAGRAVNATAQQLVSNADYLVGYKIDGNLNLQHNSKRNLSFLALNSRLEPQAVEGLSLELSEVRYVSSLARQDNGTYKYISHKREYPLESTEVQLTPTGYDTTLNSQNPGQFIVRLRDAKGQLLSQINYSVAGTANLTRSLERNAELQVKLDKNSYNAGENIQVNIIAPYTGTGLITIERDKVYTSQWFKTTTTSSVHSLTVPEGLTHNAYVNVQFFRSSTDTDIYSSPLSYAVAPFNLGRQQVNLAAELNTPELMQPGEDLNLSLTTESSARVALVAVDEGILQVAKFELPKPIDFFFQKIRLQVRTLQTLDLILPNFAQVLAAAAGGDDYEADNADLIAQNLNPFKKKRQPAVVWWSGLQDLEAGKHELSFPVPSYFNGSLRVYAVLVSQEKMQVLAQDVKVQADIILSPNTPPAVVPQDEVNLTVGVFNNIKGSDAAKFTVNLELPEGAQILGEQQQVLTLNEGKDESVTFRVKFATALGEQKLGAQTIKFIAQSGEHQTTYTESISVRPASPYRTTLHAGMVKPKKDTTLKGLRTMHPEYASSDVSVWASPLIWATGLTNYLDSYPHLCTEQLTSRALPDLILGDYPLLKSGGHMKLDNITAILRSRQNNTGGFGLWNASPDTATYATLYAAQFLLEAKDRQHPIPEDLLNNTLKFVKSYANRQHSSLAELRQAAWAIYLLARNGEVMSRELINLQADLNKYFPKQWQQDLTAAYIASSLALHQQQDLGLPLMQNLGWQEKERRQVVYQDNLTELAIHLYLQTKHFPELTPKLPEEVLYTASRAISTQNYHSHSAAWLILGLESYHQQATQSSFATELSYTQSASKDAIQLAPAANPEEQGTLIPDTATTLSIHNLGTSPVFYSAYQAGFDAQPEPAAQRGLEINRAYLGLDGKPLTTIKVGDEFLVRIQVKALLDIADQELAIVDLLPGGFEPMPNVRTEAESASAYTSPLLHSIKGPWSLSFDNLRDDRMLIYGWLRNNNTAELTYKVRAINSGTFVVPPILVSAMYEPSLQAITAPSQLVIQPADK